MLAPFQSLSPEWSIPGVKDCTILAAFEDGSPVSFSFHTALGASCRSKLQELLSSAEPISWLKQVHGDTILELPQPLIRPEADATYTFCKNTICVVQTADCLPFVFTERTPGQFHMDLYQIAKLYKYSVEAIKTVHQDYKVGGPATAGAAWVSEMIAFCSANKLPLDFISTHTYGVSQGFLDEYGSTGTVLNRDKWSVSGDMWQSRRQIAQSTMPNLELHYTEWSSSYTPSDQLHDSYHEAAYILEKIKQAGNAVNSMSYWTFTDIFEEAGPRFAPFHGGFGLLNTQGIKKPAYYSFAYLNKLGSTELSNSDSSSWICKNAKGEVQVLFWDCTYTLPDSINNQTYYIRDLPARFKNSVNISLKGIAKGKYQLELYRIGYQENDGSPVSKETVEVTSSGRFERPFSIRENEVMMLLLKRSDGKK